MRCPNCGIELKDTDRFCSNCGASIYKEEDPTKYKDDGSSKRRGIKKFVKQHIKPLMGANTIIILASLLLLVAPFIYSNITENHNHTVNYIFIILSCLVFIFGTLGIFGSSLDISRGEKLKVIDIFKRPLQTSHKIILSIYLILAFVFIFATRIFSLIPIFFVYKLIIWIGVIFFLPIIIVITIIILDNKIPKEYKRIWSLQPLAMHVIRGHRIEFYAMLSSLGGWILLETVFMGLFIFALINLSRVGVIISLLLIVILYIFYIPYLFGSIANLYRTWTEEDSFEGSTGLSNNLVTFIGGAVVTIIALCTSMLVAWLPKSNFGDMILDYMQYDMNATEFKIGNEENSITVAIPEGYNIERIRNEDDATLESDDEYIHYWYSGYSSPAERYQSDLEDDKKYENEECTYNYEEFSLTVGNKTIPAYSQTEYCSEQISNQYLYHVDIYYPVDNGGTLIVSLTNFERPFQKDNLQKFLNIK